MTYKVLIADDEMPARLRMQQMLGDLADYEVVGEAGNGGETVQMCHALSPDIVLLDIRMPDMDGIESARHLASLDYPPAVIFTTAYDNYAIEAFDAQAIGYLLKPVRQERLEKALERATRITRAQIAAVASNGNGQATRTSICVRRAAGLQLVPVDQIYYFQADQKYVTVAHSTGQDLIDDPLKDLEFEFREQFIRVHRSFLVARQYLANLEKDSEGPYRIHLSSCPEPLPVSRRHVGALKSCLKRRG
jgi:two-component system response regulator AlgR